MLRRIPLQGFATRRLGQARRHRRRLLSSLGIGVGAYVRFDYPTPRPGGRHLRQVHAQAGRQPACARCGRHDNGCSGLRLSESSDVGLDHSATGAGRRHLRYIYPQAGRHPSRARRRTHRTAALPTGGLASLRSLSRSGPCCRGRSSLPGRRLFAFGKHVRNQAVDSHRRALIHHRVEPAACHRFEVVVELLCFDLGDDFALVDLVPLAPGEPDNGALGHKVTQSGHDYRSCQLLLSLRSSAMLTGTDPLHKRGAVGAGLKPAPTPAR